jgi:hypothetical protein
MQNNFLEYIQKNGPEAFDKMAADLAKQLNDAKAQYEADQKKKVEETKKADDRALVRKQMGRLLNFYYGDDLTLDLDKAVDLMFKAVDDAMKKVEPKMKVVRDEDIPGGHVKVMRGDLSDLSDEELRNFWNDVHETFFKV